MNQPDHNHDRGPLDRVLPPPPSDMYLVANELVEAELGAIVVPAPTFPRDVARQIHKELYTANGEPTLLKKRGDLWKYNAPQWRMVTTDHIREELYRVLEVAVYCTTGKNGEETTRAWAPSRNRIGSVLDALECLVDGLIPDTHEGNMWVGRPGKYAPEEYVRVANGLLHLPTRTLEPHTPSLFSDYCLPYEYDPGAPCTRWESFLQDVFEHDPKGILLLQEYFGYVLYGAINMQKALLLLGPTRSGKGVISRVLRYLVGVSNAQSLSFSTLANEFGLEALIGKALGIFEDARAADSRYNQRVVERLLTLIAQDPVEVNRKGRPFWNGVIQARFLLVSNEAPRLLDASGAVVGRFMVLKTQKSYLGKEDTTLEGAIRTELPGILNWSLEGVEHLKKKGRFTEPDAMAETVQQMAESAAPVKTFLHEMYTITGKEVDMVPRDEVYDTYRLWCEDEGHKAAGKTEFVRRIDAAGIPGVRPSHPRTGIDGRRTRVILGLKPLPRNLFPAP